MNSRTWVQQGSELLRQELLGQSQVRTKDGKGVETTTRMEWDLVVLVQVVLVQMVSDEVVLNMGATEEVTAVVVSLDVQHVEKMDDVVATVLVVDQMIMNMLRVTTC